MVHTAAQFRGGISEEVAQAVNLDATITLAKAALEAGVTRFVFTSTGNVYRGMNLTDHAEKTIFLYQLKRYIPKPKLLQKKLY